MMWGLRAYIYPLREADKHFVENQHLTDALAGLEAELEESELNPCSSSHL